MCTYKVRTWKGSYKSSAKRSIRVSLPIYYYTFFQHSLLVFVEILYFLGRKKANFRSPFSRHNRGIPHGAKKYLQTTCTLRYSLILLFFVAFFNNFL